MNRLNSNNNPTGKKGDKLNEREVKTIKRMLKDSCSNIQIATYFGLNPSTVSRIKNGSRHKYVEI